MNNPKSGPYYDPGSEREELSRIVVLTKAFAVEDQLNLEKLFGALTKVGDFSYFAVDEHQEKNIF